MFTIEQQLTAWAEWASVTAAMNFLLLRWLSGVGHSETDETTEIACHELVMNTLSDAEKCRTIQAITDHDLRAQLTVQEAIALNEITKLLKMGARRN